MKKFLPAFLVLLTVLCGMLGITACEEKNTAHTEHTFGEWVTVKEATCAEEGLRERTCTECEFKDTEAIPVDATAHIWDEKSSSSGQDGTHTLVCKLDPTHVRKESCTYLDSVVQPTCDDAGYTEHVCVYCNYSKKDTPTEALGHSYTLFTPDPEHPGQHILTCANDPNHTKTEACEYEETTVAPGCETKGYTSHLCTLCNHYFEDDIKEPIQHKWEDHYTNIPGTHTHGRKCLNDPNHTTVEPCEFEATVTKPTCDADGYTTYTCQDCPNTYTDDIVTSPGHQFKSVEHSKGTEGETSTHEQVCTECETVVKTPCNFAANTVTKLTCTVDGVLRYTCLDCSYHYDVTTTHPDHLWSAYLSDDAGHHTRKCTREECTETQTLNCEFNEQHFPATCTEDAYTLRTCKEETCSYQLRVDDPHSALGHDWDSKKAKFGVKEEKSHEITCGNGCGETKVVACVLDQGVVTEPTCTAKGFTTYTCEKCKAQYKENETDMKPHQYEAWQSVKSYSAQNAKHERFCSECHDREEEECTIFSSHTIDPTCYEEGKTVTTCDTCRGEQTVVIQKTEHTWGNYRIDGKNGHYRVCQVEQCRAQEDTQQHVLKDGKTLPTCEGKGNNYQLCESCGYVQDENGDDIPALGHDYNGQKWIYDNEKPGHHYRECKTCGYKDITACVINTVTQDATCMKPEIKTHTCTECQNVTTEEGTALGCEYVYTDNQNGTHDRACIRGDACDNEETAQKGLQCNYKSVDTKETCTDDAYTTKTCLECAHQEVVTKPSTATGHSYDNAYTSKKDGTHTRKCSTCNAISLENCEYDSGSVTAPKCTEQGYTTFTCTKCSYAKQENYTEQSGHSWSSTYTSDQNGKHFRTCTVCAAQDTSQPCDMVVSETKAASCTSEGYTLKICKTCQYSVKTGVETQIDHQWTLQQAATEQSHNRTHTLICQTCSTTKTEKCIDDLVVTDATCTEPLKHHHVCQVCQNVYDHDESPALGHNRTTYTKESAGHHYEVCTRCGDSLLQECVGPQTKVVKPTCTVGGWTVYTCSKCEGEYTSDPIDPTGHSYLFKLWYESTDGETHYRQCPDCGLRESSQCVYETLRETKPTCTKSGSAYKKCISCNRYKTETLDALGHDFPENEWKPSGNGMQHYHMCRRPGCTARQDRTCEMVPYAESDAVCQAPDVVGKACKQCGYTTTPVGPVEHKWSAWINDGNGHHYKYCQRVGCNARAEETCNLNVQTSTYSCTTPESKTETCEVCHYTNTVITKQAPGHQWKLDSWDEDGHKAQCTVCSEEAGQGHYFEDSNICSVCKYDGLTYELNSGGASYTVVNDNRVSGAEYIVIPKIHNGFPVVGIKNHAFLSNSAIVSVVLPRSITTIGEYAFSSCSNLTSVTFADIEENAKDDEKEIALETIAPNAFSYCRLLTSFPFTQATKLKTIDNHAFENSGLENIQIPDSVQHIGANAFRATKALRDWESSASSDVFYLGKHLIKVRTSFTGTDGAFEIPEDTLTVGAEAFAGCTGIKSLTLNTAVKYFGNDAFKGCTGLTSLEYKGSLGDWLAISFANDLASPLHFVSQFHIANAQDNPEIPTKGVTAIPAGTFRGSSALKTVIIPDNITSIGARAFENCVNLATITIPDSVLYIGEDAFKGCTALINNSANWEGGAMYLGKHLVLADDAKIAQAGGTVNIRQDTITISPKVFYGMKSLTHVSIPGSVYYIGEQAFSESGLKTAKFEAAANDNTGVQYFACNKTQTMGRWLDDEIVNESSAAGSLTYYYQGYWKRTREGTKA